MKTLLAFLTVTHELQEEEGTERHVVIILSHLDYRQRQGITGVLASPGSPGSPGKEPGSLRTPLAFLTDTHELQEEEGTGWHVVVILSHLDYWRRQGISKVSSGFSIPGIPREGAGVFEDPV